MSSYYATLPCETVNIDAGTPCGPFEWWRHTIGHGGVNSLPLPERVIAGAEKLRPRLLRTFIQQYHDIYPAHGTFNWSLLDRYMESLAATGAKVVAAITIKPEPLFPRIDQAVWQPTDLAEWQGVIAALVQRYSVERPIVTYWEVGNETDIGEWGGCPFLVNDADSYFEYYRTMVAPIRKTFPAARVGGPALAGGYCSWLPEFIERCRQSDTPLDFISWHSYHDDPQEHVKLIEYMQQLPANYPGRRPELLVTEWSKGFEQVSVEEMAFEPRRAAIVAATLLAMLDAGLDWSFYYHVWDQTNFISEFSRFFADPSIMSIHWNDIPHRFGLFGVNGEVRPQYFVYQMLSRMGEEQLATQSDGALRVRAVRGEDVLSVLLVNHQDDSAADRIAKLHVTGLAPGRKMLTSYRIDNQQRWCAQTLELLPVEQREVDTFAHFDCQVFCPAESVTLVTLRKSN